MQSRTSSGAVRRFVEVATARSIRPLRRIRTFTFTVCPAGAPSRWMQRLNRGPPCSRIVVLMSVGVRMFTVRREAAAGAGAGGGAGGGEGLGVR